MLAIPLSDDDWARVSHLFAEPSNRHGRPRSDPRQLLNSILWVFVNGEKWHHLPATFPSQQTSYNRWLQWRRDGVIQSVFRELGLHAPAAPRIATTELRV
jgi:transposase